MMSAIIENTPDAASPTTPTALVAASAAAPLDAMAPTDCVIALAACVAAYAPWITRSGVQINALTSTSPPTAIASPPRPGRRAAHSVASVRFNRQIDDSSA